MGLSVDFPPRNAGPPRVRFADQADMKVVENLSLEHGDRLWFYGHEIRSLKSNILTMIWSLLSVDATVGQFAEMNMHNTSALLGQEGHLSASAAREVRSRRRAVRRAVLSEQQRRQRDSGIRSPVAVAFALARVSETSRERARIVALIHALSKDNDAAALDVQSQGSFIALAV